MSPRLPQSTRLRWALALTLAAATPKVFAFAEDICYLPNQQGIDNCDFLPPSCSLDESQITQQCKNDALASFLNAQNPQKFDQNINGRSTVHVDVSYILAQAVGFSAADAYWIAAYDEVTDLGTFQARDKLGALVSSDALGNPIVATAAIDGLERNNFAQGGVYYHFNAPYNNAANTPPVGINGLHPDVDAATTEAFLAHVRRWALDDSTAPLCSGGLTVSPSSGNYATGDSCYVSVSGQAGTLTGDLSAIGNATVDFGDLPTGLQTIKVNTGQTSDHFDSVVVAAAHSLPASLRATVAADARLGIYLHVLADRISHHVCTDASVLSGPDDVVSNGVVNSYFYEYMDNPDCVQTLHALRHEYETGVNFSGELAQDQTTDAALQALYDELVAFAQARGVYADRSGFGGPSLLRSKLSAALQIADPSQRIIGLSGVACDRQLYPFPGSPACNAF